MKRSVTVKAEKVHTFKDADSFYKWLSKHHTDDEVWIKIHKVSSGLKSITPKEAIDVVLCWGWIDGVLKGLDDTSHLQRYSPRTKTSIWSKINVENVARLIREGRMTEHGLKQVEAAKGDGRWKRAYGSRQGRPSTHGRPGPPLPPCNRHGGRLCTAPSRALSSAG